MLKKILVVLAVAVAAVLGLAVTKPDSFRVERKAVIKAPPDKVFALVSDFRQWQAWSPWEKLDPAMQRTHGGAASGPGATYAWQGNDDVGQGRMEITGTQPPNRVDIKLDFIKPFESSNTTVFSFKPQGDSTEVVWTMDGPMLFISKLMSVFFSMDKLIGKDFEAGLANMKAVAEK